MRFRTRPECLIIARCAHHFPMAAIDPAGMSYCLLNAAPA
jgi:hypothetical protein